MSCNRFPPFIEKGDLEDRDLLYIYDRSSGSKRMAPADVVADYVTQNLPPFTDPADRGDYLSTSNPLRNTADFFVFDRNGVNPTKWSIRPELVNLFPYYAKPKQYPNPKDDPNLFNIGDFVTDTELYDHTSWPWGKAPDGTNMAPPGVRFKFNDSIVYNATNAPVEMGSSPVYVTEGGPFINDEILELRKSCRVEGWGAVADFDDALGTGTDNTKAFIDAMAACPFGITGVGKFGIRNISIPSGMTIFSQSGSTDFRIRALDTSDESLPLIYSQAYLTGSSANSRQSINDVDINGRGKVPYTVLFRSFNSGITGDVAHIYGATEADIAFVTQALDGTALSSTMVNNYVEGGWHGFDAGTAKHNVLVLDPSNKATDMRISAVFSSATVSNLNIQSGAGLILTGSRCYGSPESLYLLRAGLNTVVSGNVFESNVTIDNMVSGVGPMTFGPGNYVTGELNANFGNNGSLIISRANTYRSKINHNYNDVSRKLICQDDTFLNADPFQFTNSGAASRVQTIDCYLEHQGITISSQFIGNKSGWKRPSYSQYGNANTYTLSGNAQGGSQKTEVLNVPDVRYDGVITVKLQILCTVNQTGSTSVSYIGEFGVRKIAGGKSYIETAMREDIDLSHFSIRPAITVTQNLDPSTNQPDGTINVQSVWTPASSSAFGGFVMTVA